MRGLSAPYGLSYTPGMWLNSIQVSKGVASVTAGHEAITGQINLEHRKPTDDERLFVNLYLDDELRPELNLSTALPVTKDKKLSTILLLHGSLDTHLLGDMDDNGDGFMDLPKTRLGAVASRWLYTAATGAQVRTFHSCQTVSRTEFDGGATYISLMTANAAALKEGLS